MESFRILVVDDHEVLRKGVRSILETEKEWSVCGEASTGPGAILEAGRLKPDLVVLDVSLPELNGLAVTPQILAAVPDTKILILTAHESEQMAEAALKAGARGYVLKSDAPHDLLEAVKALIHHKRYVTPRLAQRLGDHQGQAGDPGISSPSSLTSREQQICQMLAEGSSIKEVATVLDIAISTAETHRTNVMRKLNLHSMSELVRYAIRNHIVEA